MKQTNELKDISPRISPKTSIRKHLPESVEKKKKTSTGILKNCIFQSDRTVTNNNNKEMNDIYSRLTSEIELHEKWVLDFQNSKKSFNDKIFQIFEKMICSFFDFEIKV